MGEIEVTGADAGRFLDYALVGRLSAVAVGRARYTMLCHDTGGVLDDLVVYRLAERRYLVVANAANTAVVFAMLREHADGFDVDVRDASTDWALIAVQGPAAAAMLSPGTAAVLRDPGLRGRRPGRAARADRVHRRGRLRGVLPPGRPP